MLSVFCVIAELLDVSVPGLQKNYEFGSCSIFVDMVKFGMFALSFSIELYGVAFWNNSNNPLVFHSVNGCQTNTVFFSR